MTAVAFDTLKLARKLRDTAQMSQAQAEGVADALAEAMSGAELATKTDVGAVESSLRAEMAHLATKADLADAKADILRWVFAAVVGQTALIVGLLKFWH
jgi:hypothetical protein